MTATAPRRILITGASGFVGRHLIRALKASFPSADILTEHFDVTDRNAVTRAVGDARPDACIHLAGIASVVGATRDPDQAWRVNLHGALNLAEALLAHAPSCQLIFASSAEIYGASFRSGSPLDETALLAPMNAYAASKAAADLALGAMADKGLRAVRLRLFNHTGPGQAETFAAPAFARQIALIEAGRQPPVLRAGALDRLRDFVDVRDVCQAYVACLRSATHLTPGIIVNIASGVPRRIGDILDALLDMAGLRVEIVTDNALQRGSEIVSAAGNAARAYELFGWKPIVPWTQTLADVLTDWREQAPQHSSL